MDEAFMPLNEMIKNICRLDTAILDAENGIYMYINHFEIETPVELNIMTDQDGRVQIGIIPPLYRVETSIVPSYHSLRFVADKAED